jgi:predicted alpha/beta-fold hydrolase
MFPSAPLTAIGFSLGANILAKYLGEEGDDTTIKAAVVLGNPWDLMKGHVILSSSWMGDVYSRAMATSLR